MKTTHKVSLTTGSISGVATLTIMVGSMLGWNLTDKFAMVTGVLALLVNFAFAVLTTAKLPPKIEAEATKIVDDVQAVAQGLETATPEAQLSIAQSELAPTSEVLSTVANATSQISSKI